MLNTKKTWPFGLSSGISPRFLGIVLLVFTGLVLLDAPVTIAARQTPDWLFAFFALITDIGEAQWILVPGIVIALVGGLLLRANKFNQRRDKLIHLVSVAAFIVLITSGPGLFANVLKRLIGRARPIHFDELGIAYFQPFFNDWTFQSIPSGHTATIFAFATGVMFIFPKLKWAAFALAALVGLSRIIIGMHFPSDVFAGVIVGITAAFAVRNICLYRNWMFIKNEAGEIVYKRSIP